MDPNLIFTFGIPGLVIGSWLWRRMRPRIMSSISPDQTSDDTVADRLPATLSEAGQGVAKPGNAGNEMLPGQRLAAPAVPDEARDIIQFWTRVTDVERLVASGRIGKVDAIEIVFACKRSGRPESPYARANAAIQAREAAQFRQADGTLAPATYPVSHSAVQ